MGSRSAFMYHKIVLYLRELVDEYIQRERQVLFTAGSRVMTFMTASSSPTVGVLRRSARRRRAVT